MGVFGAGDDAFGFVQDDVDFLVPDYLDAIERDGVGIGINLGANGGDFPVDLDAAFGDVGFRFSAGGDTALGQEFLQSYQIVYRYACIV